MQEATVANIGAIGGAAVLPLAAPAILPAARVEQSAATLPAVPSGLSVVVHLSTLTPATLAMSMSAPSLGLYNAYGLMATAHAGPATASQISINTYGQSYRRLNQLAPEIAALLLELLLQNQNSVAILGLAAAALEITGLNCAQAGAPASPSA